MSVENEFLKIKYTMERIVEPLWIYTFQNVHGDINKRNSFNSKRL